MKNSTPKSKKITIEKVENFLTKTGFILEMEIVEILREADYNVEVNKYFLDLEESKKREIDIVARKNINNIDIVLVIECKQSLQDSWIFICSEKLPKRYYYGIKHIPLVSDLKKTKIFNETHYFNKELPLAQNYIVLDKYNEKKSNSLQIDECIYKLPKALIDIASSSYDETKTIFLPIAIFSGQIFTASYKNKLNVNESNIVNYDISFESKFYKKKDRNRLLNTNTYSEPVYDESLYNFTDTKPSSYKLSNIINTTEKLTPRFQISFVSKNGISEYLDVIENGIKKISTRK